MPSKPRHLLQGLSILFGIFALAALLIFLEQPTGSVDGVVVDEQGQALAGARVVFDRYPLEYSGKTDQAGYFRISQIPVGKYYPRIYKKGFERAYLQDKSIEEGRTLPMGRQILKPLPPRLYVDLWDNTKLPGEKLSLSVNGAKVAKIDFQVFPVDLLDFLKSGGEMRDLEQDQNLPEYFQGQKPLAQWSYSIPEAEIPEFDLKVPLRKDEQGWAYRTGLYLIHAQAASLDRSQVFTLNTLLNRTDLGFLIKRGADQFLVFASALSRPEPQAGVTLHLITEGGEAKGPATDRDGLAVLPLGNFKNQSTLVVATSPLGIAFAQAPGEPWGGEPGAGEALDGGDGAGNVFTMLYSDRPLYRPGQEVFLKGLARRRNAQGTYDPLEPEPLQLWVEDSRGNVLFDQSLHMEADGSFAARVQLPEEAELGYYQIHAELMGREYRENFEVDEYRKPEFKIEINGEKENYFGGDEIAFLIDAQYFFGAPVEAEVEWTLYRSSYFYIPPGEGLLSDPMADWMEYNEGYVGGYGEYLKEGKVATDPQGRAQVRYQTRPSTEDYRYSLLVRARDVSDRQIEREGSLIVTAGDFYFRTDRQEFLAFPNQPLALTVISRSYGGQPVSRDYKIEVKRRFWDGLAKKYLYKKVDSLKGKTGAGGRGVSEITVDRGGFYHLIISGRDSAGREVAYTDYLWVSGEGKDSEDFGMAQEIKIIPERRRFKWGETAKLFIVGPRRNGHVLLTVEGQGLYHHQLIRLNGFSKEIQLELPKEWIPNVFVEAAAIGKKDYFAGEAQLSISPEEHFLKVTVRTDKDKYQPGDLITYRVMTQDAQGQAVPAAFSLGVVDESLYSLRPDRTDIKSFFWGPRPNQVQTNYSFSGYYSGGIAKEDRNRLRRNFKDTAFWVPYLLTDAQGQAEATFTLPDNLTTWRATLVASTLSTSVGQETQKVLSTKPLIARLAAPRFFTEKDVVYLKAILHNYTESEQTVEVSLGLKGLGFVRREDDKKRSLTIPAKESRSFTYPVLAKDPGEALVQLLAKNAQVSDGVELKIPILPYGIADQQYAQGEIAAGFPGQPAQASLNLAFPPDSAPQRSWLQVILDTSLVGQLLGPLDYLVAYPYGCVEQTMSRLLPALEVGRLTRELGLSDLSLDKKLSRVIGRSLSRIYRMQNSGGGWGWWRNDPTDPFMTAYALFGLFSAERQGKKVDVRVLEQGKRALEEIVKEEFQPQGTYLLGPEGTRYFIHYVAALARLKQGVPQTINQGSPLARAFLALTLAEQGQLEKAQSLLFQLEREAQCEKGACHFVEENKYFNRNVMASAWGLLALLRAQSANQYLEEGLARYLLAQREGGHWRQTLETASALYALSAYARSQAGALEGVEAGLQWNGKVLAKIQTASPHFAGRWMGCAQGEKDCAGPEKIPLRTGSQTLSILNPREHALFYQTEFTAWSKADQFHPVDQGIGVKREYFELEAKKPGAYRARPLSGEIRKGELIGVRLTLTSPKDLHYLMVEDPLPSGFEVMGNIRFDKDTAYTSDQAVRDEKIALFRSTLKAGTHVFNYALLPELAGTFYVLPTVASEMYQPPIRGSSAGDRLVVKE